MTDAERAAAELAETLRRVNQELADNGRVSQATSDARRDAEMKAKHGIENFTAGTAKGAEAVASLASAGMSAGRAMLEGKKGAAAFNESLDGLATAAQAAGAALALLMPGGILIKGLIAGLTMATTAYIKYTQAANEMADKMYKGFSGLAKSGAAASDGMTGVKNGAQKLGLSMNELGDYVQIVADNSKDLANFGGSVYKGRQALENMGKAMEPARESMLKMGLMPKDITEGMAGYLRTQTRLGYAQKMTVDQLAEGAKKYLIEQDALTKLTGVQRAEREKAREEAMMEEQHAGVIRELQMQGERGKLEADRVQKISDIANDFSPAIAKMIRSLQSGVITDEGAKLLQSAPNAMRDLALAQKGQISELEAIKRIFGSVGESGDRFRASLAKLSANDDTFVSMGETTKARIVAEKLQTMTLEQIRKEQELQGVTGKKAADGILEGQAKLIDAQVKATKAVEDFISIGIGPAQTQTALMAEKAAMAAAGLSDLVGATQGYLAKLKEMAKPVADTATKGLESVQKVTGGAGAELVGTTGGGGVGGVAGAIVGGLLGLLGGPPGAIIGAKLGATLGTGLGATIGLMLGRDAKKNVEGGRAAGGPVDAGKLYRVGERGEEFFRPNVAGQIVPNDQIAGITSGANSRIEIIERAAKEIANDTVTLAKLTDIDLKKTQDFSRLQDRLRKLKTDLSLEEVELLEEQKNELTKMLDHMEKTMGKDKADAARRNIIMQRAMGATVSGGGTGLQMPSGMGGGTGLQMPSAAGMPSMGRGTGLQMPSAAGMPSMGGGQGLKGPEEHQAVGQSGGQGIKGPPKLTSVRSKTGKSAQVNTEFAPRFQGIIDYLDSVGYEIKSLGGFVDRDVRGKPGVKSVHGHGGAIDINPAENPMGSQLITDMPENISAVAKQLGLGWGGNWASIKDAMHFSVAKHEGGDIKLSEGGVAVGPDSGYPATLHGQEAVIPLNNAGGNFVKLFESMADSNAKMAAMMEEMVRAQKSGNDISNKMLRMQS